MKTIIAICALLISAVTLAGPAYEGQGRLFPDEMSKEGLPYAIPCVVKKGYADSKGLMCVWFTRARNLTEWDPKTQREVTYLNRARGKCMRGKCNTDTYHAGFYPEDVSFVVSIWYYIYTNEEGQAIAYLMGEGPGFKGEAVSYREAGNLLHQFYLDSNLSDEDIVFEMDNNYAGGYATWKAGDVAVTPKASGGVESAYCAPQLDDSCYVNDVKVPKADLNQFLPVVQETTVQAAGGYCDYPICYDKADRPVGIRPY